MSHKHDIHIGVEVGQHTSHIELMDHKRDIPIWFFIGALLTVYGILILGTGIYHLFKPPAQTLALSYLHADVWWPLLLLVVGLFYTIRYWPFKGSAKP